MKKPDTNLVGQKFDMLTVIELTEQRNTYGRLLYSCRCDCGGQRVASKSNLTRGEVKNCGCVKKQPKKNLVGMRFGKLLVLEYSEKENRHNRCKIYRCLCDCGKEILVDTNSLTTGNTASCGCLTAKNMSELHIAGTTPSKLKKNARKTNTSGYTGVWFDKLREKWAAEITFRGKRYRLGRYNEKKDAIAVRKEAENKLHSEFLNWYREQTMGGEK